MSRSENVSLRVHHFDGEWQHLNPSEPFNTPWVPGRMLVYCLTNQTNRHFRIALLKNDDKHFCKEFALTSPEPQIKEVHLHGDVEIELRDGNLIRLIPGQSAKIQDLSKVFSAISKPAQPKKTTDKVVYRNHEMGGACLGGLHELMKEGLLTDLTLVAQDDEEFRCHRAVLAASSAYFRAMLCGCFAESNMNKVTLCEISGAIMRLVLDYLYTGEIEITSENVQVLFTAAHMLQLSKLEDWCASYMKQQMSETNYIGVYFFAKKFNRMDLMTNAEYFITSDFVSATKAAEFLESDVEEVCEILKFDNEAVTYPETEVYEAAVRWVEFDEDARKKHIFRVMKNIRFVDIDESHFRSYIKDRSLFKECQPLQNLFEQVIYYMNHPYRWQELDFIMESRADLHRHSLLPQAIMYSTHDPQGHTCLHVYSPEQRHRVDVPIQKLSHDVMRNCTPSRRLRPGESPVSPVSSKAGGWLGTASNSIGQTEVSDPCIATLGAPSRRVYFGGGSKNGKQFVSLQHKARLTLNLIVTGPATGYTWNKHPMLINSRQQHCMAAVDSFLYAIGGCHKNKPMDSVEKYGYNPSLDKWGWIRVAPLPCKLRGSCATSFRGKLYVFGGESPAKKQRKGNLSPNVFCYDPETDRWSTLSPMKEGRTMARCAIYQGKIYVIGGLNRLDDNWLEGECPKSGEVSTCELYDPATDQWVDGPALPQPLAAPGVVKCKGKIFVLGGMLCGSPLRRVYRLSEDGAKWEVVSKSLYHPEHINTHIHSSYTTVTIGVRGVAAVNGSNQPPPRHPSLASDSDSETTCGTSMEHFDIESSSDDDEDVFPPRARMWGYSFSSSSDSGSDY